MAGIEASPGDPGRRAGHLPAHPAAVRGQAASALRPGGFAETVTRRQPQVRAGQVVRTDRTTPSAMPRQQLTRRARRDPGRFPGGRGIRNGVRGGSGVVPARWPGHCAPRLTAV
jgi:hypothetical protein